MHTYQKLRAFVISQGTKLTADSMDQLKLIKSKGMAWKHLAYCFSFIHTVLGFIIVTTVAYATPEMVHSPPRLTTFWMYIFTYLFLGLLCFLGVYQKSCTTVKVAITAFIFMQLTVLLIATRLLSQCSSMANNPPGSPDPFKVQKVQGIASITPVDCKYSAFVCNTILIPLFIHTLIFCSVFITYVYKFEKEEEEIGSLSGKKCHQFANIKIIIEEVP